MIHISDRAELLFLQNIYFLPNTRYTQRYILIQLKHVIFTLALFSVDSAARYSGLRHQHGHGGDGGTKRDSALRRDRFPGA